MSARSVWIGWSLLLLASAAALETDAATRAAMDKETTAADSSAPFIQKALQLMRGAEEIVFVVRGLYSDGHYYANFGHWSNDPAKTMHSPDGSRLCVFNLRTGRVRTLLDDPKGGIRDPRVHYDGKKLLFAYRRGGLKYYSLYEINTNGSGLRRLTSGDWDDVEPDYLPDGGIVFISTRCRRFVPCYHTQTAVLHRMDADGSNIRCLSANNVGDHRPAVLPDGRIIYTRWDYVDRAPQKFHGLWAMNPDGTRQTVFFGDNALLPSEKYVVMIDALPIPGSDKIVSVFSPGHGNRENAGNVMLIDPRGDRSGFTQISPNTKMADGWAGGDKGFRDPYPLSDECFLVAEGKSLMVLDGSSRKGQEFYRAEDIVHDPRVIRPRPRERLIVSQSQPTAATGTVVLATVHLGRNMDGVQPGQIKRLLILEDLPKPVSYYSLPGAISMDGTHTLHRILGTVPVEADGSASFEVPALRALFFVALDENGLAVKRMQSYVTVMPGEKLGCIGCHENRAQTTIQSDSLLALKSPPRQIKVIPAAPDVIDYPRDIQPILNRHCVSCHNAEKPQGRVILTGDRNEWFSQSYYSLFAFKQISDSWRYDENGNHLPYGFGTGASPLMKKLDGSHHGTVLSERERLLVRLWIETGATYAGTYAAFNSDESAVAGALVNSKKIEIGKPVGPIVQRRCLSCHGSVASLGRRHEKGRVNLPKHCWNLYNLSQPEKSMILMAPLAKEQGGYGWCLAASGRPASVFRDTTDPDYRRILDAISAAKEHQEQIGRFDMPGFHPNEHYVRWMKRFGILPPDFNQAKDPIDVYATDQAYWRSLWCRPQTPARF